MVSAIVGRLPALKYLAEASSNFFHSSSGSCRHDTSACVCTSIAIRSLTFMLRPLRLLLALPLGDADAARRPAPPATAPAPSAWARSMLAVFLRMPVEQGLQADGLGVEHRPAAIARETVTAKSRPRRCPRRACATPSPEDVEALRSAAGTGSARWISAVRVLHAAARRSSLRARGAGSRWPRDRRSARGCPARSGSNPCRSSARAARPRASAKSAW